MRIARQVSARKHWNRARGFTLVELAVAMSILLIGIASVVSATSRMNALRKYNRERGLGQNALRSMAERIHAAAYRFSEDPATWSQELLGAYGPGGTPGNTFPVLGLNVSPTQTTQGEVSFVSDETTTDADLGLELGMPRDLNGDGDALDADVTASARILPVILDLRWTGQNGESRLAHGFYVMGY